MKHALSALPGVRHVTIDYEAKRATVSYAMGQLVDPQSLTQALEQAGFSGQVIPH